MRIISLGQALLLCSLMLGQPGWAFERTDGVVVRCEAERHGERREVKEIWLGFGARLVILNIMDAAATHSWRARMVALRPW